MGKITIGGASASITVGNDDIAVAKYTGLLLPDNLAAMGAATLHVSADNGAVGAVYRLEKSVVFAPPPKISDYKAVPRNVLGIPVAFVVNEEQEWHYLDVVKGAAAIGLLRASFRCPLQAAQWVREHAQVLREHREWLAARQAG